MTQQMTRYEPAPEMDTMQLGQVLAKSGYFQDAREATQAVVKILAGREMGMGPVASMTGIYIVKGRVTLSANLMAAQIKRSGRYTYSVAEMTNERCEIVFFEIVGGQSREMGRSTFSKEDAQQAGLWGSSDPWKKTPRNMLFARAMSNGAKWYTPDVFAGPIYTPDELRNDVDTTTGEIIDNADYTPPVIVSEAPQLPAPKGERELVGRLRDLVTQARAQGKAIPALPVPRDMTDEELHDAIRQIEGLIAASGGDVLPPKENDTSAQVAAAIAAEMEAAP